MSLNSILKHPLFGFGKTLISFSKIGLTSVVLITLISSEEVQVFPKLFVTNNETKYSPELSNIILEGFCRSEFTGLTPSFSLTSKFQFQLSILELALPKKLIELPIPAVVKSALALHEK